MLKPLEIMVIGNMGKDPVTSYETRIALSTSDRSERSFRKDVKIVEKLTGEIPKGSVKFSIDVNKILKKEKKEKKEEERRRSVEDFWCEMENNCD